MKIKTVDTTYEEVMAKQIPKHKKPRHPSFILRSVINIASVLELYRAHYKCEGKLPPKSDGPCLILMNHSSFIDLKIAHRIMFPRPVSVVCTYDAMVGKRWLMRWMGCIPTRKFVSDLALIHDMKHALTHGTNVLLYPEAGYSFDGTATSMPKLAKLCKMLKVPVVYIETKGAYIRDPLYNELRIRKVPVSATVSTLFTKDELEALDDDAINSRLDFAFSFDNFAWQRENAISVNTPERAAGLERMLYRCPHCKTDGKMKGEGITITCNACGKSYTLTEFGELSANEGETEFSHIPDWYRWERSEVRGELEEGTYSFDIPVKISIMNDFKALYNVGEGRLSHTPEGFHLTGCDGKLNFSQKALASYSLNADFFWYEIGDVISIGDSHALYYCFPKTEIPVAKARLAAEELYKMHQDKEFHKSHSGACEHPSTPLPANN